MEIISKGRITFSDLSANRGVVLVQSELELHRDKPEPGHDILAGIWLPDGDGPGLTQVVSIDYHFGNKCWYLKVEHSRNQRNELVPGTLPELISKFEGRFSVKLPVIKVRHLGVGIYPAHTSKVEENPWAFVDGQFYTVQSKDRGRRTVVADVRNGRALISFVRGDEVSETFEPAIVLSADDWRSLTPITS